MCDRPQPRPGWHHHENSLGLELADNDGPAVVDSFFDVFQQSVSMSRVVAYDPIL